MYRNQSLRALNSLFCFKAVTHYFCKNDNLGIALKQDMLKNKKEEEKWK